MWIEKSPLLPSKNIMYNVEEKEWGKQFDPKHSVRDGLLHRYQRARTGTEKMYLVCRAFLAFHIYPFRNGRV